MRRSERVSTSQEGNLPRGQRRRTCSRGRPRGGGSCGSMSAPLHQRQTSRSPRRCRDTHVYVARSAAVISFGKKPARMSSAARCRASVAPGVQTQLLARFPCLCKPTKSRNSPSCTSGEMPCPSPTPSFANNRANVGEASKASFVASCATLPRRTASIFSRSRR